MGIPRKLHMPGRLSLTLILLFCGGMLSLQWVRNYAARGNQAPQLKPSLELAAEDGTTKWFLLANGTKLGEAYSQVLKTSRGVFTLKQTVDLNGDLEAYLGPVVTAAARMVNISLKDLTITLGTQMELTYLGTMRELQLSFTARPKSLAKVNISAKPAATHEDEEENHDKPANLLQLHIRGVVEDDQLIFKGLVTLAGMKIPIEDYKIKHRNKDTFFSTMAPTDCLAGLRLGQRWQTAVLDPTEMLTSGLAQSKTKELTSGVLDTDDFVKKRATEVRVLDELKVLEWGGAKVLCFVVQSQDRGTKMQAWVNAGTARVLRQVVEWPDHSMELLRVPKKEE
jgi:hypothetical protein